MIKIKELDVELSIRLGEPREDNGDGLSFKLVDRLRYINHGYSKLVRMLSMTMRKYAPFFAQRRKIVLDEAIEYKDGGFYLKSPFITIEDLILKFPAGQGKETSKRINPIKNESHLGLLYELNESQAIKASSDNMFYSINPDKKILLVPAPQIKPAKCSYACVEDTVQYNLDDTIPIDNDHRDLLITFAAAEAMSDLPYPAKMNGYRQLINDDLSIFNQYATLMERREGGLGG